jgi:hypothetical protein
LGTLIRHVFCAAATAIAILPEAVILPTLDAALIPTVGGAMLLTPRPATTLLAAIALTPVAAGANREQRPTVRVSATS